MLDSFFEYGNSREAREWAYKHFGGKSSYPKPVASAIGTYSGSAYEDINAALRATGGDISKLDDPGLVVKTRNGKIVDKARVKDLIIKIDEGMQFGPGTPQWTTVRRGTSMREFVSLGIGQDDDLKDHLGKTYKVKSYISTSLDTQAAFAGKKVQIEIKVPKGTKGIHMAGDANHKDALSGIPEEEEWLLPRDTEFTIISAELVNGQWRVVVEAIQ